MSDHTLWVPFSVLNSTTQTVSTRLIWLLLAREPSGLTDVRLRQLSGLNQGTIAMARASIARAPLALCYVKPHPACAAMPWPLLTNPELSAGARLLYGQLHSVPDFRHPHGSFTYSVLIRLTGRSDYALRQAVADLVTAGWISITKANRRPISFTLRDPVSARLRARISAIRRKVRSAQYRGETLLREFLNTLIALNNYEDNATPDVLINPFTGELMELDRYYPSVGAAVEFNGDQHYEETDLATFPETVKQVGRDAMKAFICKARGLELVIIRPEDLRLKTIDQRLPQSLPRRDLEGLEPLVAALEELASEYRDRSEEERARKGPRRSGGQSLRLMRHGAEPGPPPAAPAKA